MIYWLHLSDIHFSYNNHTNKSIRDSLIEYVDSLQYKFDAIFITGDIAYKAEYTNDIEAYFQRLSSASRCELRNFFVCTGNHDFKRGNNRSNTVMLNKVDYLKNDERLVDEQYEYLFSTGHKQFTKNIRGILPSVYNLEDIHYFEEREEFTVTILNTCLFSHDDKDKNELYILDNKFYDVMANYKNKRKKSKLNIAIGHHSYDWLNDKQQKRFCHYLEDNNIDLYFCGHNHDFNYKILEDTSIKQFTSGSIFEQMNEKICFLLGQYSTDTGKYSLELHSYNTNNNTWGIDINSNRKFVDGRFEDKLTRWACNVSSEKLHTLDSYEFQSILLGIKKKAKEFIGYNEELNNIKSNIIEIFNNLDNGDYIYIHARELYGKSYLCAKLIYDLCINSVSNELDLASNGIIFVDGKRVNSSQRAIEIIREQASNIIGYDIILDDNIVNGEENYQPITEMEKIQKILFELKKYRSKILIVIDAINEISINEIQFFPPVLPCGICFLVSSRNSNIKLFPKKSTFELNGFDEEEIVETLCCDDMKFISQVRKRTKGCPKLIMDVAESLKYVDGDITQVKIKASGKEYFDAKIMEWKANPILEKLMVIFGVFGYVSPLNLDQLQDYLYKEKAISNISGEEIISALDTVRNQLLEIEVDNKKSFKIYYSLFVDRINGRGTTRDLVSGVESITDWMLRSSTLFEFDVIGRYFVYWINELNENSNDFLLTILDKLVDEEKKEVLERIAASMFIENRNISQKTLCFYEENSSKIESELIYRILCYLYSNKGSKYESSEKLIRIISDLASTGKYTWAITDLGIHLVDGNGIEKNQKEGERLLRESVRQGDVYAMVSLGWRLLDGENIEQNKDEGESLLREAIELGSIVALRTLGSRLIDGENVEKNCEEGERLLREAIAQGDIYAMSDLGIYLLDGENVEQNCEEGERLLREAVAQGHTYAMGILGWYILDGEKIKQNKKEGELLLRKAVELDDIDAMRILGLQLIDGNNIEKSRGEGERLLREAAKRGDISAIGSLGWYLLDGKNIRQNCEEGKRLLREAVEQGDIDSIGILGVHLIDGENLKQDIEEGESLLRKAIANGNVYAMVSLGWRLIEGSNIEQDKEEGERLLREAIDSGDVDAIRILGMYLLDVGFITGRIEEGERLLRDAVEKGDVDSMSTLGWHLIEGSVIEQDKEEGERLLREAIKHGNIDAMGILGVSLLDGMCIEQNKEEGEKLLREAANNGDIYSIKTLGYRLFEGISIIQDKREGERLLREAISKGDIDSLSILAEQLYKENRKKEAGDLFKKSADKHNMNSEINLAYMIRKHEYIAIDRKEVENLLYKHVFNDRPDIVAIINYALFKVEHSRDIDKWEEVNEIMLKLKIYSKEEIIERVQWWVDLSVSGDLEGDFVIAWLSKLGIIDDIGGIEFKDRLDKVLKSQLFDVNW